LSLSENVSPAELLASLPPEQLATFLKRTSDRDLEAIEHDWGWWGRRNQQAFIYRGEYYEREPPVEDIQKHTVWRGKIADLRNKAEVIVAKQRHGPTGTVRLHFDHDTTRFSNLAAQRGEV
jgi:hypothetical protein